MPTPNPHPLAQTWPPARLRVVTPRVELRLPTDEDIAHLARVAIDGVHDAGMMPFAAPWSEERPELLPRRMYAWHAQCRASWTPASWHLLFAAYVDGEPVGAQDLIATDFGILREVDTASWLARSAQGRGIGTEMRHAVLHLSFTGLGAVAANSGAYEDNAASNGVSRKVGYADNGVRSVVRSRGPMAPGGESSERAMELRYRIEREAWESTSTSHADVEVHGLDAELLEFMGVSSSD